mmetsp:Transcript_4370/g.13749  ORF Transcript_4370/g.13749 Transcript_4370/m.13749 type:complete len:278 (-) Transcript_4370:472-1305(-)
MDRCGLPKAEKSFFWSAGAAALTLPSHHLHRFLLHCCVTNFLASLRSWYMSWKQACTTASRSAHAGAVFASAVSASPRSASCTCNMPVGAPRSLACWKFAFWAKTRNTAGESSILRSFGVRLTSPSWPVGPWQATYTTSFESGRSRERLCSAGSTAKSRRSCIASAVLETMTRFGTGRCTNRIAGAFSFVHGSPLFDGASVMTQSKPRINGVEMASCGYGFRLWNALTHCSPQIRSFRTPAPAHEPVWFSRAKCATRAHCAFTYLEPPPKGRDEYSA